MQEPPSCWEQMLGVPQGSSVKDREEASSLWECRGKDKAGEISELWKPGPETAL